MKGKIITYVVVIIMGVIIWKMAGIIAVGVGIIAGIIIKLMGANNGLL